MSNIQDHMEAALAAGEVMLERTVGQVKTDDRLRSLFGDVAKIPEQAAAARALIESEHLVQQLQAAETSQDVFGVAGAFLKACFENEKLVSILARSYLNGVTACLVSHDPEFKALVEAQHA